MKIKILPSKQSLMLAAKALGYVAAGAVLAQAGSALVKRFSASAAAFAATNPNKEAIVDLLAGILAAGAGHMLAVKMKVKGASVAGPLMLAGAALSAAAPLVQPMLSAQIDSLVARLPAPGGHYYSPRLPGGVSSIDVPYVGGRSSLDVPRISRPGGMMPAQMDVPFPLA